jgi:hypothetical protein
MSKESFEQLGIVVATFQRLEHLLLCVLAERWTPTKGKFMSSWVCSERFPDILKEVKELTRSELTDGEHDQIFSSVNQLHHIRNDWVHSYYQFDRGSSEPTIISRIRSERWKLYEELMDSDSKKKDNPRSALDGETLGGCEDSLRTARSVINHKTARQWKDNPAMYQVKTHLPDRDEFRRFMTLSSEVIPTLERLIKTDIDPVGSYFDSTAGSVSDVACEESSQSRRG